MTISERDNVLATMATSHRQSKNLNLLHAQLRAQYKRNDASCQIGQMLQSRTFLSHRAALFRVSV